MSHPPIQLDGLPRRIILSRKGSDAAWGGRPSVRLGTELVSLPIPESPHRAAMAAAEGNGTRYGDLPSHPRLGALHEHLRGLSAQDYVHLDPDLRPELRPARFRRGQSRHERLFGQEGAAERHLRNQEVGPGDLFLFFGWFREAFPTKGGWKQVGPHLHLVWGWLQIAESAALNQPNAGKTPTWAKHHPHACQKRSFDAQNRVYRASKVTTFLPDVPGAGVFRYHPGLHLTRSCTPATRGQWCLPAFFRSTGLTYNRTDGTACPSSAERLHVSSAPIGQEFVFPANRPFFDGERAAVGAWLAHLFQGAEGV